MGHNAEDVGDRRRIAVCGDPLRALDRLGEVFSPRQQSPALLVVGVDARRVRTRADFIALLRHRKRTALDITGSVPHIVAVIHLAHVESWMHAVVHRWAMSIHRRLQSARGVDTAVTALLVDWRTGMDLVAERIEELAQRPPGVNPAAVLWATEIHVKTIAEASTNDFI
jgi:hypothetical protein